MAYFHNFGRILIYIGLMIAGLGGLLYLLGDNLAWFGHLPGDIRIERDNFVFYFPLTTMILISLILNFIIRFIRFFLK